MLSLYHNNNKQVSFEKEFLLALQYQNNKEHMESVI